MSILPDEPQRQTELDFKEATEIFLRDDKLGILSDETTAELVGKLTIAIALNRLVEACQTK